MNYTVWDCLKKEYINAGNIWMRKITLFAIHRMKSPGILWQLPPHPLKNSHWFCYARKTSAAV